MSDTLIAVIPRSRLSATLAAFHRNGYGHVTRVLDPAGAGGAATRPRRVHKSRIASADLVDAVVLFVPAPKLTADAAALAVAHGATDAEVVSWARRSPRQSSLG